MDGSTLGSMSVRITVALGEISEIASALTPRLSTLDR